jgi:phage tail sheath gpL-like
MGNITNSSVAAGMSVEVKNVPLAFDGEVLARKILIIATALSSYAGKHPAGVPFPVLSPEDTASKCGPGSMAHRLALTAFRGSRESIPVYVLIEEDAQGAAAATGTLTLAATDAEAETLSLYVSGKLYRIIVKAGDTETVLGEKVAAAITADEACPVYAENTDGVVMFTAKTNGSWGNYITIALNQRKAEGQVTPAGVAAAITPMSGGAGLPDFATDLRNGLGSGDSANEDGYTAVIHGYGKDPVVLDALSEYNGTGNENVGLYSETVARPFRSLVGDVSTGSNGLSALISFTGNRKLDRTSGIIAKPGSLTHPAEIAAEVLGYMEFCNADLAEKGYCGAPLSGVDPGLEARLAGQDWTTEYTNRDLAVHSGVSTVIVRGGSVIIQNIVSFYRPDNIPEKSRCFRRMRDISIIQNIQANYKALFGLEKWENFTVVSDVANVQNSKDRALARDKDMVRDDLYALIMAFTGMGWLYSPDPSVKFLKTPLAVQERDGGTGYNTRVPYVLSGEGNILDNTVELDTSFAVMKNL